MKNILVTIDFNTNELLLIEKAMEMAKAFKSKIWLLHVTSPEPEFVGYSVGPQHIRDNRAEELRAEHRMIENYTEQIRLQEIDCEGLLIKGATIEMIMKKAAILDIDLIVTGHVDHSMFYNAFFGSVSAGVIKKASIPVLVVPL